MTKEPAKVKRILHQKILSAYDPMRTRESCDDHWVDWFAIDEEEFDRISRKALAERAANKPKDQISLLPSSLDWRVSALLRALLSSVDARKLKRVRDMLKADGMDVEVEDLARVRRELEERLE